jgi:hypothetical protein
MTLSFAPAINVTVLCNYKCLELVIHNLLLFAKPEFVLTADRKQLIIAYTYDIVWWPSK